MENAWQLFLRQLASADLEFTYDDVCGWSADEFDALTGAGLLSEAAQATYVACDVCPDAHWERVLWSEDGHRAFIRCPLAGTLDVDLERLRMWRASPGQVSTWLAHALALSGKVQPLPASRLWFLGRRRATGRTPYFFFAAIGSDELPSAMKEIRQAYGSVTGVLLLPFSPAEPVEAGKLQLVDLGLVVSLQSRCVVADFGFIEDQLTDANRAGARQGSQAENAPRSLAAHRRSILRAAIIRKELDGMGALARHLGASETALNGMVRGDKTRYADEKLACVLKKLDCSPAKWNRVSKPSGRQ